jgi:hypothetical protein
MQRKDVVMMGNHSVQSKAAVAAVPWMMVFVVREEVQASVINEEAAGGLSL